ncbi:MAG: hypothetical protein DWQ01_04260 [Planctomycetota bacterium]|nr:MAG: hypothetical protein DWQ01_04260 [Planctomycetota bacterium]
MNLPSFQFTRRSTKAGLADLAGQTGEAKSGRALWGMLFVALCFGALLLPLLTAGDKASEEDRGDDPLVGSLPCMVEPTDLDIMFWLPLGGVPQNQNLIQNPIATLGFIGQNELDGVLLDANGNPFGRINEGSGWTCFGMVQGGDVILDRTACANLDDVALWQWVPDVFLGGQLTYVGAQGTTEYPIVTQYLPLPLAEVALQAEGTGASVILTPNPQNLDLGTLQIDFDVTLSTVVVTYQP